MNEGPRKERRIQKMNDSQIVDLYWQRNEQAIAETAGKYGNYCYKIAYNILADSLTAHSTIKYLPSRTKAGIFIVIYLILSHSQIGAYQGIFKPELAVSSH